MDDRVLRIAPRQRCVWCQRLTDVAIGGPLDGSKSLRLDPGCWQHGYIEVSPKEEKASIERFVTGYHRHQGTARFISSVDLAAVPGYQPEIVTEQNRYAHIPERAWKVRYIDTEGQQHTLFVVWSFERWSFFLRDPEKLPAHL